MALSIAVMSINTIMMHPTTTIEIPIEDMVQGMIIGETEGEIMTGTGAGAETAIGIGIAEIGIKLEIEIETGEDPVDIGQIKTKGMTIHVMITMTTMIVIVAMNESMMIIHDTMNTSNP